MRKYYFNEYCTSKDSPGLKEAMRSITYEQAKTYRPGKYDIMVESYIPSCAYILKYASKTALSILSFLDAWCYAQPSIRFHCYYDIPSRAVILCIKNKEYHTVWKDDKGAC